jgi:hypothetical protein
MDEASYQAIQQWVREWLVQHPASGESNLDLDFVLWAK